MSFSIGAEIGAYTITDELGKGGMATVYKAHHNKLARDVAVKVMHPTYSGEATFIRRFEREARVVARLEHPHIVPVYDYAVHDNHPYLVMRYIKGETLKDRLNEGKLSKGELLRLIDAITDALDYAHGEGVLHRDIKPSNILLTAGRGVYITDFGLARVMQSGESTLSHGMIMGTPHYISPEQAKGIAELDGRADLYSLGVILYEMTTGRVPFRADSDFSIIHSQIFDPPPLPSTLNENISPRLEMVLLKALEKEPENRYSTAGEMAAALHRALDDMPSDISPIGAAALPDYTPMAMTQVAMDDLDAPIQEDAPPSSPSLPTPPPSKTPLPEPIAPEVSPPKKDGKKRTAVFIGGGIVLLLLLVAGMFFVMSTMMGDDDEEDYGDTDITNPEQPNEPISDSGEPNGDIPPLPPLDDVPNLAPVRPLEEILTLIEEDAISQLSATELALARLEDGDWDGATELVARHFTNIKKPSVFVQTAEMLVENGHVELAYIVLERAMIQFEDTPRLLNGGRVQRMLLAIDVWYRDTDGVQALAERIVQHPSPANDPILSMAEAYMLAHAAGETDPAEGLLVPMTDEEHPYKADAYFLLGSLANEFEQGDDAFYFWEQALASDPLNWMRTLIEYDMEQE